MSSIDHIQHLGFLWWPSRKHPYPHQQWSLEIPRVWEVGAQFLKRKYEAKLEISKGRGTVSRISGYETHVHVCERDTVCVLPPKWMSATASTLWMTMIHVGCFDILEKIPKPCLENLNSNFCSLVMKYIVFCQTNLKQNNLNKCVICQQQQTKFKTY